MQVVDNNRDMLTTGIANSQKESWEQNMENRRQTKGVETWERLQRWGHGSADSERLAAHILRSEGYAGIDPSHPLGGRDGKRDIVATKDGKKWVGAVFFCRDQQRFPKILDKFKKDLAGVKENTATGMAFVTNQELRLGERKQLEKEAGDIEIDLFHLDLSFGFYR